MQCFKVNIGYLQPNPSVVDQDNLSVPLENVLLNHKDVMVELTVAIDQMKGIVVS